MCGIFAYTGSKPAERILVEGLRTLERGYDSAGIYLPGEGIFKSVGTVDVLAHEVAGHISAEPRGDNGFGFDPIFIPEGESQTWAETPGPSLRGAALAQVAAFINS
jgi:hypothetical protein